MVVLVLYYQHLLNKKSNYFKKEHLNQTIKSTDRIPLFEVNSFFDNIIHYYQLNYYFNTEARATFL